MTFFVTWQSLVSPESPSLFEDLPSSYSHILVSERGVVFFRSQTDLTDELQKELAHKLGVLTGKPESSSLHVHPLANFNGDKDKHLNVITTDKAACPAEDLFKNQAERPLGARGSWHTDIGYEPYPSDYTILKITKKPETGGGPSHDSEPSMIF